MPPAPRGGPAAAGQLGLLRGHLGQSLLCGHDAGAGLFELTGQAAALVAGTLHVDACRLAAGVMAVGRPLGRGPRVAGPGQDDARLGQVRPRQLGRGGSLLGPATRLFDRGGGDDARARSHPPAAGGEAVTLGGDHDEVVAGEREVDGLLPAVDAHGPADQRVEHRLGDGTTLADPDVAAHRLGAAPRRQRADVGPRLAWRQDGAGDAAVAQRGQRGLGGPLARRRPPRPRPHRPPLRRRRPSPRRSRPGRRASPPRRRRRATARARRRPGGRRGHARALRPAARAVPRLLGVVGRRLGHFGVAYGRLELAVRAAKSACRPSVACSSSPEVVAKRSARTAAPVGALFERRHAPRQRLEVLLLAAGGPGDELGARTHAGDRLVRRLVAEHPGPPFAQRRLFGRQRARDSASSWRSGAPPAASSASASASSLARRAPSASSVETTSTSAAASRAATTPRPRSRSTPDRPRARSTRPCTRPSALARSSSRRDDNSAVVLVASASSRSSASCSSRSSSRQTVRPVRRHLARHQVGQLGAGQVPAHREELAGHRVVRTAAAA